MTAPSLLQLTGRGQSIWIDVLSRPLIREGGLAAWVRDDQVTGVTSNPTIFQKAISGSADYDDDLRACYEEGLDTKSTFFRLALKDIRDACDILRPTWEGTGGADGFVSMEVEPGIAHQSEPTFEQAIWIDDQVDKPNLLVKIPATLEGLPAIEASIARGTSINITLIFGLDRYDAVVEAYLTGLERLAEAGGDLSRVTSVASFFVSRVDTEADKRLEAAGKEYLRGKLGIANAKIAYDHFLKAFSGPRWEALAARGATKQRPLWASTSTKNPAYSDVMYVEELIGPDTVNTMPPETLEAFSDHGEVRGDTIREGLAEAEHLLEALTEAGVDYDDVIDTLEAEGIQKFTDSFDELIAGIEAKRETLAVA
jgi:transaldolase